MQVGNWSSAYFTVAIAVHAFNSLVLKKRQSILISLPTMIIGWAMAGIAGAHASFCIYFVTYQELTAPQHPFRSFSTRLKVMSMGRLDSPVVSVICFQNSSLFSTCFR